MSDFGEYRPNVNIPKEANRVAYV